MNKINFSYAFARPYVMTFCEPKASDKYIARVFEDRIEFAYAERTPKSIYPLSWELLPTTVNLGLQAFIDGKQLSLDTVKRTASGIPKMEISTEDGRFALEVIGCKTGLIIKTVFRSGDIHLNGEVILNQIGGWVVSNRGYVDGIHKNVLLKMNHGRADKMLAYATGADSFTVKTSQAATEIDVPMPEMETKSIDPKKSIDMLFSVAENTVRTAYLFLPYNSYFGQLESISKMNFDQEMRRAEKRWLKFFDNFAHFYIEDEQVRHCYNACLADMFVMHDTFMLGRTGFVCGTDVYRSSNSGEPLMATILTDTLGYTSQALKDSRMYLEAQDENGCWASTREWTHDIWDVIYFKVFFIYNHYLITRDTDYLRQYYPQIKKSVLFNAAARQANRTPEAGSHYGFMPFGMGDCGMSDNGEFYGYYFPHNFLAARADQLAAEIAGILDEKEDAAAFAKIAQEAVEDLIRSARENSGFDGQNRYIPAAPSKTESSMFGCLFAAYPGKLLSAEDALIQGTIAHIFKRGISEGGLPVGTGWQKDGLWVAMALDNFSQAFLRFGMYQQAADFLYPSLNHASPLVTWCEERGAEKGSATTSGDLHHFWTPFAVVSYLASAFAFENEDILHITAGLPAEWYTQKVIADVQGLCTSCGKTDFKLVRENGGHRFTFSAQRAPGRLIIHCLNAAGQRKQLQLPRTSEQIDLFFREENGEFISI